MSDSVNIGGVQVPTLILFLGLAGIAALVIVNSK